MHFHCHCFLFGHVNCYYQIVESQEPRLSELVPSLQPSLLVPSHQLRTGGKYEHDGKEKESSLGFLARYKTFKRRRLFPLQFIFRISRHVSVISI